MSHPDPSTDHPTGPRPRGRTLHRSPLLAAGAVLGLALLTGCGGNGLESSPGADPSVTTPPATASASGTPTPDPSAPADPSPSTTPSSPSSSSSSSTAPSATATGAGVCALSQLAVTVRPEEGGGTAGSTYVLLAFRNTSSATCTLDGHPGVSFVGGSDGTQLGAPAARTSATRLVRLAPGRSTTALLQIAEAGNFDAEQCAPTTADGFRVYPPDSRASTFVRFRVQACQRPLGDQHQLTVSAVGRAG